MLKRANKNGNDWMLLVWKGLLEVNHRKQKEQLAANLQKSKQKLEKPQLGWANTHVNSTEELVMCPRHSVWRKESMLKRLHWNKWKRIRVVFHGCQIGAWRNSLYLQRAEFFIEYKNGDLFTVIKVHECAWIHRVTPLAKCKLPSRNESVFPDGRLKNKTKQKPFPGNCLTSHGNTPMKWLLLPSSPPTLCQTLLPSLGQAC